MKIFNINADNYLAKRVLRLVSVVMMAIILNACAAKPITPYSEDVSPLILLPASQAGITDKRGRFREIFCSVLEERGAALPDYRPCDEALTKVGIEAGKTGKKVELGQSERKLVAAIVPGVGWDCISEWLEMNFSGQTHLRQFGYDQIILKIDALSGISKNARQIRDAIMQMPLEDSGPRLVLVGYSKGAPDILEAVVTYPEIRERIAAVISTAGAVGGSVLANDATQSQAELLSHFPGAQCNPGDGGAVESLRPAIRKAWLAENTLPKDVPYYSLATYPKPERISSVLQSSYDKVSLVDARNDSQLLFYDQVIPGSTLIGYVNADHWAIAVPIARTHPTLGSTLVDKNDYPREALLEAILRFIEEDLSLADK